ncbi:response regulator transcription factor [Croceicoccus gelatinilyticus]|uniref:response regulator transcription factor n=1 Tax=Croceicoccus gelatinilyticus TaxID=2835536 RepID=UPI001BCD245B|nr:winged helix-turn-helix domain-containing protein [Croceicoccus gelatinilyticus]MBS7671062.1 winged helix-turn-helix domain-containing protein [Croceicoccus gelatinilyticus]
MIADDFLPDDAFSDCTGPDKHEIAETLPRIDIAEPIAGIAFVSLDLPDAPDRIATRLRAGRKVIAPATVARKSQRVAALSLGAHEFLTLGPLDPDQLSARLDLLAGRSALPVDMALDARCGVLSLGDGAHALNEREARLFAVLLDRRGGFATHDELLQEVWGSREYDRQKLRVLINRLRKRIEPEPDMPRYLLAEAAIGYRIGRPASHRHI